MKKQVARKQCRQCKKKVEKDSGIMVKLSYVHEECLDEFIASHVKKGRSKRAGEVKHKASKTSPLTLTQTVFNKFIRIRDASPNGECISCNRVVIYGSPTCHAGHYYTRGARSDLRFNEDNVFAQCQNCNNYGDAETAVRFKESVIKKIGQKKFDTLAHRSQQDYSDKNLKKIRKKYAKKIKELE